MQVIVLTFVASEQSKIYNYLLSVYIPVVFRPDARETVGKTCEFVVDVRRLLWV